MGSNANSAMTSIKIEEGMQIRLDPCNFQPRGLFALTAACSSMLGGNPVHRGGFLPGVSLPVHVVWPATPDELEYQLSSLWPQAQYSIEDWIEVAEQFPCLRLPVNGARITLALDRLHTLEKGVVRFDASPPDAGRRSRRATPPTPTY